MRQRPVRLTNNKHLRSCETLPLKDLHALTVARVISIKDPPIGVVILGSMPWLTGVGKSWIACALGNQAARDGVSVLYKRLSRLLDELAIARLHGRQARLLKTLARTRLLILDDWAMVKLTADQRRDLMEVIDDRHDRGSTIVATQIPQDSWHLQIGDPTYADAILDRLVNNAYRLELTGKSMRGNGARRAVADPVGDEIGEQSK